MKRSLIVLAGLVLTVAVAAGCDWEYTDYGYGYYADYGYGYYDPAPVYYAPPLAYCETVCDYWGCWDECY